MYRSENVDAKKLESFRLLISQELEEAIEFAVHRRSNEPECSTEELLQVGQEAAGELMAPSVEALMDAYKRSPLNEPDYAAIAVIFERLAIRAKAYELVQRANTEHIYVRVETRPGVVMGELRGFLEVDGMEAIRINETDGSGNEITEHDIPIIAITDFHFIGTKDQFIK